MASVRLDAVAQAVCPSGRIVYVVAHRTGGAPDAALTYEELTSDDAEIAGAVPLKYGDPWPLGLDDGASLPGANLQGKSVSRRSKWHRCRW